jgi:hypothetical protein
VHHRATADREAELAVGGRSVRRPEDERRGRIGPVAPVHAEVVTLCVAATYIAESII